MVQTMNFQPSNPENRQNPNSLRLLFIIIRTKLRGKKTQKAFAEELSGLGNYYKGKRVSVTTVGRIEKDSEFINYIHIEKYATYAKIPSGLLLLFSRMLANKRDNESRESNSDIARKIIQIMRQIDENTNFDESELDVWSKIWEPPEPTLL